jgi:two-component system, LytTR family, response regulator LytT
LKLSLPKYRGVNPTIKNGSSFKLGEKIKKVEVSRYCLFLCARQGLLPAHFQGNNYPVEYTLDKLESLLDPSSFFRINRKYLVNMAAIVSMVAYSRGRVKLELKPKADDEFETIVSIDRSGDFKKWLNN